MYSYFKSYVEICSGWSFGKMISRSCNIIKLVRKTVSRRLIIAGLSILISSGIVLASDGSESPTPPPGDYRLSADSAQIRFPFEIFRGDIRFRCRINDHDVHMLLDDGFMWDQLLFWGGPVVDSLGLNYDGEIAIGSRSHA